MQLDTSQWTKNDFTAFLLFYLAESDMTLAENELEVITHSLSGSRREEIQKLSESCNDIQCIEVITELRNKFYPGKEGKEALERKIDELLNSDDNIEQIEFSAAHALRRII